MFRLVAKLQMETATSVAVYKGICISIAFQKNTLL